jgi:hypothetical protein
MAAAVIPPFPTPIIKESELEWNEAGTKTIATILASEHNCIFWQRVTNAF